MGPRQVGFLSQLYPMTCTSDYWWPNVRAMSTPSTSICLQQLCYCQPLLLQWPSPHGSYSSLSASLSAFPDILFLWTFHHGLAWVSHSRICDSELQVCTNWRLLVILIPWITSTCIFISYTPKLFIFDFIRVPRTINACYKVGIQRQYHVHWLREWKGEVPGGYDRSLHAHKDCGTSMP